MYEMFDLYGELGDSWMSARSAEYIYEYTSKGSILRKFVNQLIITGGLLCSRVISAQKEPEKYKAEWAEWKALIEKGGELVSDVTLKSFSRDLHQRADGYSETVYLPQNHAKYPFPLTGRPVEEFLEGKTRACTTQG